MALCTQNKLIDYKAYCLFNLFHMNLLDSKIAIQVEYESSIRMASIALDSMEYESPLT